MLAELTKMSIAILEETGHVSDEGAVEAITEVLDLVPTIVGGFSSRTGLANI